MTVMKASMEVAGALLFGATGGGLLALLGLTSSFWLAGGVLASLYILGVLSQELINWQGERILFATFYAVDELRDSIIGIGRTMVDTGLLTVSALRSVKAARTVEC